MGAPRNGTGHRIPDKRKKKRRSLRGEVLRELTIPVVSTNAYVPAPTVTSLNRLPVDVTIKC